MEEGDRHVADHAGEAVGASVDFHDVLAHGRRGAREDTFHLAAVELLGHEPAPRLVAAVVDGPDAVDNVLAVGLLRRPAL
eukprot:203151-Alexandrium_andersonii.AAC.1